MSSKSILIRRWSAFVALCATMGCSVALAQAPPASTETTSIERGTEAEKALKLKEPSFETREARLKAKPLNWNATIGKPKAKPKAVTQAEREALRKAKPEKSESGEPDPNAEKEARRLHPSDWENVK
jgi:hypothetical protein